MDVHPPHHPLHSWRDFFIHIATIVVGLLIAIGLEQSVEWWHHREQVHDAEQRLAKEIRSNAGTLDQDEDLLNENDADVLTDLATLRALREHTRDAATPKLVSSWSWNGLQDVAWTTARDTSVLALMPYADVEPISDVYLQQRYVQEAADAYIRIMTGLRAPLQGRHTLEDLSPADLDAMIASCQETLTQIEYLHALMRPLHAEYQRTLAGLHPR